jgi:hypothetical protein
MATKLSVNGSYMEYIVIKPTFGFDKYKSWTKIISRVNYIILEEGLSRLDYAGEQIDDYENKHKEMIAYLKSINPLIGTTKQK